jgi:hypothetical protein
MSVVTELLRLKENPGTEPIDEARGLLKVQADEVAEEYEVTER